MGVRYTSEEMEELHVLRVARAAHYLYAAISYAKKAKKGWILINLCW